MSDALGENWMLAHGLLLSIAWFLLVPIGIITALLRLQWNFIGKERNEDLLPFSVFSLSSSPKGRRWLVIHAWFMSCAAVFTLVAWIIAVWNVSRNNEIHFAGKHPKLGTILLFVLLPLQLFLGFALVGKRGDAIQRIQLWCHRFVGFLCVTFPAVTCYYGLIRFTKTFDYSKDWIVWYLRLVPIVYGILAAIVGGSFVLKLYRVWRRDRGVIFVADEDEPLIAED
jgi:hypothetical protein